MKKIMEIKQELFMVSRKAMDRTTRKSIIENLGEQMRKK